MSRHYNTKHPDRSRTDDTRGYRKRLQSRGLGKAPALADVDVLRNRQERRVVATCTLDHNHDADFSHSDHCDGVPFPFAGLDDFEDLGAD